MNTKYAEIDSQVKNADMPFTLEEMHGLLCGILVSGTGKTDVSTYIAAVTNDEDLLSNTHIDNLLTKMYQETIEDLQSPTLQFEPLLPDDDYPLDERMSAISAWARGLVIGLAKQGIDNSPSSSADSCAFISDMYEVSQAEFQVTFDEESELIYSELVEYLKMGTLLLQEELNPVEMLSPTKIH